MRLALNRKRSFPASSITLAISVGANPKIDACIFNKYFKI